MPIKKALVIQLTRSKGILYIKLCVVFAASIGCVIGAVKVRAESRDLAGRHSSVLTRGSQAWCFLSALPQGDEGNGPLEFPGGFADEKGLIVVGNQCECVIEL